MKTSNNGRKILVPLVAALLTGCGSEEGPPIGPGSEPAPPPPPPRAAPTLPEIEAPQLLTVETSVTGAKARDWAKRQPPAKPILAASIPAAATAELIDLLTPISKSAPTLRWVVVMKRKSKAPARALAVSFEAGGADGRVGFAVAAVGSGLSVTEAATVVKRANAKWRFGKSRDFDGDGVADVTVIFNQTSEADDAGEAGLVLMGSAAAATVPIHLGGKLRKSEAGRRQRSPLTNCWSDIDGRKVLLVVVQNETELVVDQATGPAITPETMTYGADPAGKLGRIEVFAGVVGSAKTPMLMLEDWRNWVGDSKATPTIAQPPMAVAGDPTVCPKKKRLAFILPGMTTKPPAGSGYALLAWPSLDKNVTMAGIREAHLPDGALVKLGRSRETLAE